MKKRRKRVVKEYAEESDKLRLYRKLKSKLELEDYVIELDRAKRRELTMLRGGTNRLRIEIGRWTRVEGFVKCLSNEVEDEKHFLLMCPIYAKEREEMFERISEECEVNEIVRMEVEEKMQILIGIGWRKKGKEIRRRVVDYIKRANEIRKRYITLT